MRVVLMKVPLQQTGGIVVRVDDEEVKEQSKKKKRISLRNTIIDPRDGGVVTNYLQISKKIVHQIMHNQAPSHPS